MVRTRVHPQAGEGMALFGILLFLLLEAIAFAVAPARGRLLVGGILIGAGTAALIVAAAMMHARRTRQRQLSGVAEGDGFSADALEGFPMEGVRPLLLGPGAPSLNRLYTAWVLATHGRDGDWIAHHLDLPAGTAQLLVEAARRHGFRRLPGPSPRMP